MRAKHDKRAKQSGFTLVELLIAMSILTFGILVIASMQISSMRGNTVSGLVTDASNFAVDKTETLMRLGYRDAALDDSDTDGISGIGDASVATADHSETKTSVSGKTYNIFWNIAENEPRTGTKTVKVTVIWNERGVQKSTSLDLIKADM